MQKKIQTIHGFRQHLYSFLISVCCMSAAVLICFLYYRRTIKNSVNITLVLTLLIIVVSSKTAGYIYGIACSVFVMFCLSCLCKYSRILASLVSGGHPFTLFLMCVISVYVSMLASRLTSQSRLLAKRKLQLLELKQETMRANLLRAISHDLRGPLTGIWGNSQVYLENWENLTDQEKIDIMTNICEDSEWLINMVENLLAVTRMGADGPTITTSQEAVEEVVSEALQKLERRHPGCLIVARVPEELIMLPMDALLIEQVIINLLENALYHSDSKHPIELIVKDSSKDVFFTVRDYGRGIPEDKLDSLFEAADHIHASTSDSYRGLGIGLAICKTIINAHHGILTGYNHAQGAEFTFILPKRKEIDDEYENRNPSDRG